MAEFNPKDHMTKIGKGQYAKDYLEVKWRIVWFRSEHPSWGLDTIPMILSENAAIVKAVITDENNRVIATGMATVRSADNATWSGRDFEKAETAAIGRALAHAGFGTQFTGEDEGDFLADSPVERSFTSQDSKLSEEPPIADGQEGYSDPTTKVQIIRTKNGNTMTVIGGASMFSREPLRKLGFNADWLADNAAPGDYELSDPVTVVYQQNGKYKNIRRIRRDNTDKVEHAKAS